MPRLSKAQKYDKIRGQVACIWGCFLHGHSDAQARYLNGLFDMMKKFEPKLWNTLTKELLSKLPRVGKEDR